MKRFVFLIFALAAAACCPTPSDLMQGYGEADYIYISSQDAGVVAEISVQEGARVDTTTPLFRLNPQRLDLQADSAAAQQNALAAAVRTAQAQAVLARRSYDRSAALFEDGYVSRARLDTDRAALDAANAQLNQAQRQVRAASAESSLAEVRASDLTVLAPAAGTIERIFHRQGELVAAGAPIVALLTPQNMKVRFFAPEARLSELAVGTQVLVSCDGCAENLTARVSFVAREPQFTPPVIYSLDQREKLVFLVEARFDAPTNVRPGMPVDVRLASAE